MGTKIYLVITLCLFLTSCEYKEEQPREGWPEAKFERGDIVIHTMTKTKGQILHPDTGRNLYYRARGVSCRVRLYAPFTLVAREMFQTYDCHRNPYAMGHTVIRLINQAELNKP